MPRILISGNTLRFNNRTMRCAVGKNGFAADKKEGDGRTPVGTFPLRECWYRADRLSTPQTKLPLRIITENDGWCDEPGVAEYNQHVTLPFTPSHEKLFRDDHVYDLIIPLGYNDDSVIPGAGSAIFLHLAHPDYRGTEGCIALALPDFLKILHECSKETTIEIMTNQEAL